MCETLYGWLQLLGLSSSLHSRFHSTGTFYNPGPFCGFIAILTPLALYYVLNCRSRPLYWLSYAYLVLSVSLMPALMGRTGWLAAVVGCSYVLFACKRFQRPKGKTLWLVIVGAIAVCTLLFFLKPLSALGRILLWRNGLSALFENPLTGVGWDNVTGALGDAQENYFAANPDSPFAHVAGCPEYAFNEFLQLAIAYGIIGLAAFIALLYLSIRCARIAGQHGLAGSVLAFVVVCMSSYPLQFPEFIISVAILILISIWSCPNVSAIAISSISIPLAALVLFFCITIGGRRAKSGEWDKIKYIYQYRLVEKDCQYLDSILVEQSWNNRFLFDYGKALRQNGCFQKSNDILMRGAVQSSDPMFLNLIGRNYHDLHNYTMAEHYFIRSTNRLPGRMYPYYLLAKLYADSANFNYPKFSMTFKKAISMEPKVMSPAINQMKHELYALNDSINKDVHSDKSL